MSLCLYFDVMFVVVVGLPVVGTVVLLVMELVIVVVVVVLTDVVVMVGCHMLLTRDRHFSLTRVLTHSFPHEFVFGISISKSPSVDTLNISKTICFIFQSGPIRTTHCSL